MNLIKKAEKHRVLLLTFIISLGLIILMQGLIMFSLGFHNMDQSQNLMRLSKTYDINLVDATMYGGVMTLPDLYILGTRMITTSLYYIVIGVSLIWIAFLKK